jgi:hypothetical protein
VRPNHPIARNLAVIRTLPWCGLLATVAALVAVPDRSTAAPTVTESETLIRIDADPARAPKPALRYLLLPDLKEQTPGNPIPNYLKCMLDQDFSKNEETLSRAALRQADAAARMDRPDWQILPKVKTDGISLLLPDLQKMRFLASELQVRFRDEIATHSYDDALYTARTMFALSRHMGEHPTLIGGLVAIAIAQVAIGPFEEMLAQPGCPNLYWALTNLPTPFITLDRGMEGERLLIHAEIHERAGLKDDVVMAPEQIRKVVKYIDYLRDFEPDRNNKTTHVYVTLKAKDPKYVSAARERLVEYGLKAEMVAKFPPEQVILLDEKREYEVHRDEEAKLMNLPTWEYVARARRELPKKDVALFDLLLAAFYKVRLAQGRLEQRIAMLRHVEAIRMYAAENGGKLPQKLADITVPLPLDPFTGKPFRYDVQGAVAHLRGTPPPGDEKNPAYNVHYEITIRK